MATSDAAFVGSIPRYYDQYLVPIIFDEYAADLAQRVAVPPRGTVLEIAAGTGIVTLRLREALPDDVGMVVTDLNEPMLDLARRKFDSPANIEFQTADAARLPFPNAAFGAVVCQFSLMFFPDKRAAMQEAARVLTPGGAFVFSVWDSFEHNHFIQTVNHTLARLFPANPPPFFDTPYGYHSIDAVKTLAAEAGFTEMDIHVLPRVSRADRARNVALGFILGTPVCAQIVERGEPELKAVVDAVERDLQKTYGPAAIRAKMQAIVFRARLSGRGRTTSIL
ncbi:MAG: class I SAM-dependent methyltransferase [Anaerolineae bacterium]